MGETSSDTSVVHLRTTKDWPRWIALIKTKAKQKGIWDTIDPDASEPTELAEPAAPIPKNAAGNIVEIAALTAIELEAFKIARDDWKTKRKLFEKKKDVLNDIEDYVIRTTSNFWSAIEHADGLYAKLVALKARVAPSSYAREVEALNRWNLANQNAKNTRTEDWIAEWEAALAEAKLHKLPDVEGIRPTRKFLQAVESIAPSFSTHWINQIESIAVTQPEKRLEDVIPGGPQIATILRNQLRTKPIKGSFASTLQGQEAPADKEAEKGKNGCFDGRKHSINNCFYLNPGLRPQGWQMRKNSAEKVIQGLEKDPVLRGKHQQVYKEIKTYLEQLKNKDPKDSAKDSNQADESALAGSAFAGIPNYAPPTCFATGSYPLYNSWIFDSGSPNHIANQKERLQSLIYLDQPEQILCGDTSAWITAYGEADIQVQTLQGAKVFHLTRVALIEGFHVNIVSHKRIRLAGYSWDDINLTIKQDQKVICSMEEKYGQYVLDYQPKQAVFASSKGPRPIREADAKGWHLRCGHIGKEALEKLISAAYGVKIQGQLTLECEDCIQAKAKEHVSRRPSNQRSPRPFWRISIDLFEQVQSMTNMARALVIQDEYSGEIWVYPLPDKSQDIVVGALQDFTTMIRTQWDLRICRIRRDNEKALGKQYDQWIKKEGIHDEPTPVYTPAENGRAERSGGVVREKALSMQLGANLPAELWHETWPAAAYLYNRSPRSMNGWKSPIETRNKWLRQAGKDVPEIQDSPDLSNLWAYGCKAYPLREEIKAGKSRVENRTQPRTHLGYLVGYEGSSIYRVWIPSKATVIRTRDVDFVETEFYDPTKQERSTQEVIQIEDSVIEPLPGNQSDDTESESEAESTIVVDVPDQEDYIEQEDTAGDMEYSPPIDYPTPQSDLDDQPRRSGRTRQPSERAAQNIKQSGSVYRSGYAVSLLRELPAMASFALGSKHRLHRRDLPLEPRTWKELSTHLYGQEFIEAAEVEVDTIKDMGTIQVVPRDQAKSKPIPLTWVFKYKLDNAGYLIKFKARICVRGDLQPITDQETYAATLAARSFRILMALAARWKLKMRQLDAINAFPNSELDEEVYIELPPGFKEPGKVARLLRALYGLRRSPVLWQRLLSETLSQLGLCVVPEEPCLFVNDWLIVFFYVDDIVYMYREQDEDRADLFRDALTSQFKMRDLGDLQWFLGIHVTYDWSNQRIWLNQQSYIEEIARRFRLTDIKGAAPNTPRSSAQLDPYDGITDQGLTHLFQRKTGSINYAAVITRPDISRTTSELASYMANPSAEHMQEINRCIQYLYGTQKLGILYDGKQTYQREFEVFTDASFADDPETRRSSQGWLMKLYGGPVAWNASRQTTVTTSSTEAELLALSFVAKETVAVSRLFTGLRFHLDQSLYIWCDNKQTIRLVTSELQRLRTALRHVDIHQCWIRQEVQKGTIQVEYVATTDMAADGLTKVLPRIKFKAFIRQLGLVDTPGTSIQGADQSSCE
jgi:hypothetical protein